MDRGIYGTLCLCEKVINRGRNFLGSKKVENALSFALIGLMAVIAVVSGLNLIGWFSYYHVNPYNPYSHITTAITYAALLVIPFAYFFAHRGKRMAGLVLTFLSMQVAGYLVFWRWGSLRMHPLFYPSWVRIAWYPSLLLLYVVGVYGATIFLRRRNVPSAAFLALFIGVTGYSSHFLLMDRYQKATRLYQRAKSHARRGQPRKAISRLTKVIQLEKEGRLGYLPYAYELKAGMEAMVGDTLEAVEDYQRAIVSTADTGVIRAAKRGILRIGGVTDNIEMAGVIKKLDNKNELTRDPYLLQEPRNGRELRVYSGLIFLVRQGDTYFAAKIINATPDSLCYVCIPASNENGQIKVDISETKMPRECRRAIIEQNASNKSNRTTISCANLSVSIVLPDRVLVPVPKEGIRPTEIALTKYLEFADVSIAESRLVWFGK